MSSHAARVVHVRPDGKVGSGGVAGWHLQVGGPMVDTLYMCRVGAGVVDLGLALQCLWQSTKFDATTDIWNSW